MLSLSSEIPISKKAITDLLSIGTGGFFGAMSRFSVSQFIISPLDILLVNVTGSLFLGMLMYGNEYLGYIRPRTRMAFGIGFLGSFTTYSTFAVQSYQMDAQAAFVNITANTTLALIAVFIGRAIAIYLSRRRH